MGNGERYLRHQISKINISVRGKGTCFNKGDGRQYDHSSDDEHQQKNHESLTVSVQCFIFHKRSASSMAILTDPNHLIIISQ